MKMDTPTKCEVMIPEVTNSTPGIVNNTVLPHINDSLEYNPASSRKLNNITHSEMRELRRAKKKAKKNG